MLRITVSDEYGEVTIVRDEALTIYEYLDMCRDAAISMTYLETSWNEAISEEMDRINRGPDARHIHQCWCTR